MITRSGIRHQLRPKKAFSDMIFLNLLGNQLSSYLNYIKSTKLHSIIPFEF